MPFLAPPKDVIRVWHHHRVFDRTAYRDPAVHKRPTPPGHWRAETTELVTNGELRVAAAYAASEIFRRSLVLFDYAADAASHAVLAYRTPMQPATLFSVGRHPDGELGLQLNPTDPAFTGYPRRAGFAVAPLRVGQPVRVLLNARWWHGLSRRGATRYYEWDFAYYYHGEFGTYAAVAGPQPVTLDVAAAKLVDLRKPLH